jgi:hypothetical protein
MRILGTYKKNMFTAVAFNFLLNCSLALHVLDKLVTYSIVLLLLFLLFTKHITCLNKVQLRVQGDNSTRDRSVLL